jgi:hypothetical protein
MSAPTPPLQNPELVPGGVKLIEKTQNVTDGPEVRMLSGPEALDLPQAMDVIFAEPRPPVPPVGNGVDKLRPHKLEDHFGMHPAQLRGPLQPNPPVGILTGNRKVVLGTGHGSMLGSTGRMRMESGEVWSYVKPVQGVGRRAEPTWRLRRFT